MFLHLQKLKIKHGHAIIYFVDMLLLKLIFHRQDTQELLKKLLEREKPETP